MKVIVIHRSDDYIATVEDQVGAWGIGNSGNAAIGNLVSSHPELFGLEPIEWPPPATKERHQPQASGDNAIVDAPVCKECGAVMALDGDCYKCGNCGHKANQFGEKIS